MGWTKLELVYGDTYRHYALPGDPKRRPVNIPNHVRVRWPDGTVLTHKARKRFFTPHTIHDTGGGLGPNPYFYPVIYNFLSIDNRSF